MIRGRGRSRRRAALGVFASLLAASALGQPSSRVDLPRSPNPSIGALVGEYAAGGARAVVRENAGTLEVSFDARTFRALRDLGRDSYVTTEPIGSTALRFERGANSTVQGLSVGGAYFERRDPGADGTFRIRPLRPVAELRREAERAAPPVETGDFLPSDLVEVRRLDSSIRLDVRYATTRNFLSTPVYERARVLLQRPTAEALVRAHRALRSSGYGLLLHDGYRPWAVTKVFWEATPEGQREFVADPARGSKHNRGCAIDLTLFDLRTKKPVEMPGLYDEMSPRSYPDYPGGTSRQRALRDLLRGALEAEGFTVYETEWWHFDFKDWRRYRIGNEKLR